MLYAFSDFVHPETNAPISEHAVNELKDGELIDERFEGDDYRLMIVANKFQTGFDQRASRSSHASLTPTAINLRQHHSVPSPPGKGERASGSW